MTRAAIANSSESQLVVIDMQERLSGVMAPDALASVIKNCGILLQAAKLLDVPAIYTEQYPKGLGATLSYLTQWLTPESRVEKTSLILPVKSRHGITQRPPWRREANTRCRNAA